MNNGTSLRSLLLRASVAVILIFGLQNVTAVAQLSTGDIVGTVTDSSGAIIPGAKVVLTNTGTQVQTNAVSNGSGNYLLTFLQPGNYSLRIEAPGFESLVLTNITVSAGDRLRENAGLKVGSVSQTVEVTPDSPLMQRESSTLGTVISQQETQDLHSAAAGRDRGQPHCDFFRRASG
jgi:hypothetical protein